MSEPATVRQARPIDGEELDDVLPDDDQRRALDAAITMSLQQAASGQLAPATRVLARLRARRR